jgi:PAS domain S-box-containing protein
MLSGENSDEKLKWLVERYRLILEHAPDAIVILDAKSGKFVDANATACEIFEIPPERITEYGPLALSPEQQPDGRSSVEAASGWIGKALNAGPLVFEWEHQSLSGRVFPCEVRLLPLPTHAGGVWLRGSIVDISERKRAELEVRESRERFKTIFELVADGIFIYSDVGHLIAVNPAACALHGQTEAELLSQSPMQFIHPDSHSVFYDFIAAVDRGEVFRGEAQGVHADGGVFDVEVVGKRFYQNGQKYYFGSVCDISARKIAERRTLEINAELERRVAKRTGELQQAMTQLMRSEKLAALGGLVAGLAHELNTPLGNILGAATTLKQRLQDFILNQGFDLSVTSDLSEFLAMSNEAADILARNAERAGDLVANFKQVAADQTSERWRRFNLRTVVQQAIATLRPALRGLPHSIDVQIPESIEMQGYPGPLEQVVLNLTTNALDHALASRADPKAEAAAAVRSGRIQISASTGGGMVHLIFADDGAGIPAEHIDHIFEPFFTTRLSKGGTGLGLYLVYQLVTGVLQGEIDVSSAPGAGTKFGIHIPRELARKSAASR